ncbi:MAG: ATP-binding domain-containing protein, partial [Proteobacteria bacterium]|nr:ATP-binding domain-containing protein [Pseudomonadota bacterium]
LAGFLEHVALVMELNQAEGQDLVNVMTLHSAKGLEFDTVFLAGWEEGLFPNQRALDEHGMRALEEERRLAYVGLTRARERVVISFVANRRLHGSWTPALPSRFLDELPKEHVEVESDPGLYGATGANPGFDRDGGSSGDESAGGFSELDATHWSPGMARAHRRRARGDALIEAKARVAEGPPSETFAPETFTRGMRVFHRKFGYGTVLSADGARLYIDFDKAGKKKVVSDFVVPEGQAG